MKINPTGGADSYVQCHICLKVKRNVYGARWERNEYWGSLEINGYTICNRCRNCREPV